MNKRNMPNQPFDDDIAELFAAQEIEVPAELDDHIRNMAKAELGENSAASRYAPVFATAAVLVLAVALVPMLIDQSTSPKISSSAAIEPMAAAPESAEIAAEASFSDLAITADTASNEARAKVRAESMSLARQTEKTNEFADATSTMKMPSGISTLTAPATAIANNSDNEAAHRVSQASWLEELNRLYEAEEQAIFLDELTLFKKQYPNYDLSKSLPPAALKLNLSD